MRVPAPALLIALLSIAADGASAAPLPNPHGWGKAGVSYLQFRTDTVECGYAAAQVKMPSIVGTPPSVPTIAAAPPPMSPGGASAGGLSADQLDVLESYVQNYQQYTMIVENQVADLVQAALDKCLISRGYRPFKVTSKQMGQLRRLRKGTRERYLYIYALGTDPAVAASQGL